MLIEVKSLLEFGGLCPGCLISAAFFVWPLCFPSDTTGKPTWASDALITQGLGDGYSGPLGLPTSIHLVHFLGVRSLCVVDPSNFRLWSFSTETTDAIVVR